MAPSRGTATRSPGPPSPRVSPPAACHGTTNGTVAANTLAPASLVISRSIEYVPGAKLSTSWAGGAPAALTKNRSSPLTSICHEVIAVPGGVTAVMSNVTSPLGAMLFTLTVTCGAAKTCSVIVSVAVLLFESVTVRITVLSPVVRYVCDVFRSIGSNGPAANVSVLPSPYSTLHALMEVLSAGSESTPSKAISVLTVTLSPLGCSGLTRSTASVPGARVETVSVAPVATWLPSWAKTA